MGVIRCFHELTRKMASAVLSENHPANVWLRIIMTLAETAHAYTHALASTDKRSEPVDSTKL